MSPLKIISIFSTLYDTFRVLPGVFSLLTFNIVTDIARLVFIILLSNFYLNPLLCTFFSFHTFLWAHKTFLFINSSQSTCYFIPSLFTLLSPSTCFSTHILNSMSYFFIQFSFKFTFSVTFLCSQVSLLISEITLTPALCSPCSISFDSKYQ